MNLHQPDSHPCKQVSWLKAGRVVTVVSQRCTRTMDGYVRGGRNAVGRARVNGSQTNVLNVAGPRASEDPKIYGTTRRLLTVLIKMMSLGSRESQDTGK